MQITEGELFALLVAEKALQQYRGTSFEKPLLSAIKKMAQALPDTISLNLADWEQTISFRTRAEPILNLEIFDALAKAAAQRQQLELTYRKPGQREPEMRVVDPYHLANINGEWFLFACDHVRKDIRTFVPARIQSVEADRQNLCAPAKIFAGKAVARQFRRPFRRGRISKWSSASTHCVADYIREKKWHESQELARIEGRRRGIAHETFQPGRNGALGLELGRRRESLEAARTGGIRPHRCAKNPRRLARCLTNSQSPDRRRA